jgi:hypothetical protein
MTKYSLNSESESQYKAHLIIRPVRANFPTNPSENSSSNSFLALEKTTKTTQQQ